MLSCPKQSPATLTSFSSVYCSYAETPAVNPKAPGDGGDTLFFLRVKDEIFIEIPFGEKISIKYCLP